MNQKMNPTELFNWSDKPVEGGGGGFGQVYKVRMKRYIYSPPSQLTLEMYACKVVRIITGGNEDKIENEIRAVQKICHSRHPNIVDVISNCTHLWKGDPAYFIQMELCDGDMESYIRFRHRLGVSIEVAEAADTMVQVLDGLVYLHSHDEVHRDLKPRNGAIYTRIITNLVLYVDVWTLDQMDPIKPIKKVWKIADFGFTSPTNSGHDISSAQGRMTVGYCAPELMSRHTYSKKVDVWGVGCISYEFCMGKRAFYSNEEVLAYSWHQIEIPQISFCQPLNVLVTDCLAIKPEERPDSRSVRDRFKQLLADPRGSTAEQINTLRDDSEHLPSVVKSTVGLKGVSFDKAGTAHIISDQASLFLDQGRYSEAEKLYEWALEFQQMKQNQFGLSDTMYGLATAYLHQARYVQAERLFRRCVEHYKELQKDESREMAKAITGLGTVGLRQGYYADAEEKFHAALSMLDQVEEGNEVEIADTLIVLGVSYGCRGKYDLEANCFERAVGIMTRLWGKEGHPGTAKALRALGDSEYHRGRYKDSEARYRWAHTVQEKICGKEHPDTLETLNSLGRHYLTMGRTDDSVMTHRSVFEIQSKTIGKDHPRVVNTLSCLGVAYGHQRLYRKEELALQQALSIQQRVLPLDHPRRALLLSDLGAAWIKQKKFKEAESVYREAHDILENRFGKDHPAMAKALEGLGIANGKQGRHKFEAKLLQTARTIAMSTLGPNHPDTARATYNLAAACVTLKQYGDAEKYYRNACEVWENSLGIEHQYTTLSRGNLQSLPHLKGAIFRRTKN